MSETYQKRARLVVMNRKRKYKVVYPPALEHGFILSNSINIMAEYDVKVTAFMGGKHIQINMLAKEADEE